MPAADVAGQEPILSVKDLVVRYRTGSKGHVDAVQRLRYRI